MLYGKDQESRDHLYRSCSDSGKIQVKALLGNGECRSRRDWNFECANAVQRSKGMTVSTIAIRLAWRTFTCNE